MVKSQKCDVLITPHMFMPCARLYGFSFFESISKTKIVRLVPSFFDLCKRCSSSSLTQRPWPRPNATIDNLEFRHLLASSCTINRRSVGTTTASCLHYSAQRAKSRRGFSFLRTCKRYLPMIPWAQAGIAWEVQQSKHKPTSRIVECDLFTADDHPCRISIVSNIS